MKKFSFLQIGVYVACVVGVILAVLIFSGKIPLGDTTQKKVKGTVTMWGTLPIMQIRSVTGLMAKEYPDLRIEYQQKDPQTFQVDFVNALASGAGPDVVMVDSSTIIQNAKRLLPIPYASLPLQTFQSTFVDQGSSIHERAGVLALPLFVDPIVMYYNKDILTSSFAVKTPETWDEVLALTKQVTKRDEVGALAVSTVAMGSFDNITHAKEVLALLVFQLRGSFTGYDKDKKVYYSTFGSGATQRTEAPAATAFKFYTGFAKSSNADQYTWNPSMPNDRTQFVAGKLAVYFGAANEMVTLRKMNPNLNFGVAIVPQSAVQNTRVTYGNLIGTAVTKMSKQPAAALVVANQFAQKTSVDVLLAANPGYAPARRDMLGQSSADDPLKTVVYRSAIISKSLLDPEPVQTTRILKQLVDRVNAGTLTPESVPNVGDALFRELLSAVQQ